MKPKAIDDSSSSKILPRASRPEISIIVPIYNMSRYLNSCLESVLKQNFRDFEVILVDDCSTDGSPIIEKKYAQLDARVRYLKMRKNRGPGAARNLGLKEARGKYVRFLDPDDLYPSESLKTLYRLIVDNDVPIASGNSGSYTAGIIQRQDYHIEKQGVVSVDQCPSLWVPLHHQRYIFKRSMLLKEGIEYPALRRGQDLVMMARVLCSQSRIAVTHEIVYLHRCYPNTRHFTGRQMLDGLRAYAITNRYFLLHGKKKYAFLLLLYRYVPYLYHCLIVSDSIVVTDEVVGLLHDILSPFTAFDFQSINIYPYQFNTAYYYIFLLLVANNSTPEKLFQLLLSSHFMNHLTKIGSPKANTHRVFAIATLATLLAKEQYRKVALFGAGKHTPWLLDVLQHVCMHHHSMDIIAIFDDNSPLNDIYGIPVIRPARHHLEKLDVDAVILSTDCHQKTFLSRCRKLWGNKIEYIDMYETREEVPEHPNRSVTFKC